MSFLSHLKQITIFSVTDTNISVRDISRTDKKIVSEHSVNIPAGVVTRGIVMDTTRFSEALTNLRAQAGSSLSKVIFNIPEQQCFTATCVLPIDISTEQIRDKVIAHAKTIIPIHHTDMYIGYLKPSPISGTTTESCMYMAVDGNVFDTYVQIFETSHIEISGVTSVDIADPMLHIQISDFKQAESTNSSVKTKMEVANIKTPTSIDSIKIKRIATYIFITLAFVILGYILYTYIIMPFI